MKNLITVICCAVVLGGCKGAESKADAAASASVSASAAVSAPPVESAAPAASASAASVETVTTAMPVSNTTVTSTTKKRKNHGHLTVIDPAVFAARNTQNYFLGGAGSTPAGIAFR